MSEESQSSQRDVATTDALNDRLAALRERMASLGDDIGARTLTPPPMSPTAVTPAPTVPLQPQPPQPTPQGPAPVAVPPEARTMRPEPLTPAPGVDPDDPVLKLGVADPDALDAWLTDDMAAFDPTATGEMEPVTTEMDAITKPSVYDTLAPDDRVRMWPSPPPREGVTVEAVDGAEEIYTGSDARRWITLVVVAVVLIGMGVAVAWWLSSQSDPNDAMTVLWLV